MQQQPFKHHFMHVPVGKNLGIVAGQIIADLQIRKVDRRIFGIDHVQL